MALNGTDQKLQSSIGSVRTGMLGTRLLLTADLLLAVVGTHTEPHALCGMWYIVPLTLMKRALVCSVALQMFWFAVWLSHCRVPITSATNRFLLMSSSLPTLFLSGIVLGTYSSISSLPNLYKVHILPFACAVFELVELYQYAVYAERFEVLLTN